MIDVPVPPVPEWLAHCSVGPGDAAGDGAWRPLSQFLAAENLRRRQRAVADQLAQLGGSPEATGSCAWSLVALNVMGWIVAPVLVHAMAGLRPLAGWAGALACGPRDVGPIELRVLSPRLGQRADGPEEICPGVGELVGQLREALVRVGVTEAQLVSGFGCALHQVAAGAPGNARTQTVVDALWRRCAPSVARRAGSPAAADFVRPSCCGLSELAGDPQLGCADCPRRGQAFSAPAPRPRGR